MTRRAIFIAGRPVETGETSVVRNPYSGEVLAEVCLGGEKEAEAAIRATVTAFGSSRRLPAHKRAAALQKIAVDITQRHEEFSRCLSAESGKPITDARREVGRAISTFTIAAEEAKRIPGEAVPLDISPGTDRHVGFVRRFPIGPVLGITPFNFPLNLVAHKVAPALAVGNPIVLKPAPQTPLTSLLLGEVLGGLDLPQGMFSIVPCTNAVAERMVTDDRFAMLSFTGSAPVGWKLKSKAGKKRVVLELGGNAGVIVEPDADLDYAAERCAIGGYGYSGQTCISVQRIYVHESVYQPFLEGLLKRVRALKAGNPNDESTTIGPLIDEGAAKRVESWIQEAVAGGAKVQLGGKREGSVVEATVLTDVRSEMKVNSEEAFGPLVNVTPYRTFEQAIAALNDSPYGLQAGVFTRDINKAFKAYEDIEAGAVLINEIPTFRADQMPYGGVKNSGLGREGVRYAIEEMTERKLLVLNLT
ncbi:MAG TPA: aldehyde dehydrogenase family protein [Nitrospirales bacterium]|jgi:glyceraldehyde-3-phosphate dehydrogenase (NADP+)